MEEKEIHPPKSANTKNPRMSTSHSGNLKAKALNLEPLPSDSLQILNNLLQELIADLEQIPGENNATKNKLQYLAAIDHVKAFHLIAQKKNFQAEQKKEISQQIADIESKINSFDKQTQNLESKLEDRLKHSRENLLNQCQKKIDDNELLWSSTEQLRKYNRPSNQLRHLRLQEKQLLISGRFNKSYADTFSDIAPLLFLLKYSFTSGFGLILLSFKIL